MKKLSLRNIGCYLSTMVVFNIIYLMKMKHNNIFTYLFWTNINVVDLIRVSIVLLFIMGGVVFTIFLYFWNDTPKHKNTLGKQIITSNVRNLSADTYLGKYSLLILTGLSLPTDSGFFSLTIYLIIFMTIAVIFVNENLIYINPMFSVFGYHLYSCTSIHKDTNGNDYLLICGDIVKDEQNIRIKNINQWILKTNKIDGKEE